MIQSDNSINDNYLNEFTKENINTYLNALSKQIKKEYGRDAKIEIIIVGGGSILLNYDFREGTQDIDMFIPSRHSISEAINRIGDQFKLPNGWMNSDFVKTSSFSPKLAEVSKHYRTFNQVLEVRTLNSEYLIAMKIASARPYKHDLSDIVGIVFEEKAKRDFNFELVEAAYQKLYDSAIPEKYANDLLQLFRLENSKQFQDYYNKTRSKEIENKEALVTFEEQYKNVLAEDNLDSILQTLMERKEPDPVVQEFIAQNPQFENVHLVHINEYLFCETLYQEYLVSIKDANGQWVDISDNISAALNELNIDTDISDSNDDIEP